MPTTREHNHRARVAETIGLAIIALAILVVTLVRFGHAIRWSIR